MEGIIMLINAQGKDVTKAIAKMERNNPQVFKKNRESILRNLREALVPGKPYPGSMFQLGERARMV